MIWKKSQNFQKNSMDDEIENTQNNVSTDSDRAVFHTITPLSTNQNQNEPFATLSFLVIPGIAIQLTESQKHTKFCLYGSCCLEKYPQMITSYFGFKLLLHVNAISGIIGDIFYIPSGSDFDVKVKMIFLCVSVKNDVLKHHFVPFHWWKSENRVDFENFNIVWSSQDLCWSDGKSNDSFVHYIYSIVSKL